MKPVPCAVVVVVRRCLGNPLGALEPGVEAGLVSAGVVAVFLHDLRVARIVAQL